MDSMALEMLVVPVVLATAGSMAACGLATAFARLVAKLAGHPAGGRCIAPEPRSRPAGRPTLQLHHALPFGPASGTSRPLGGVMYRDRIA